MKKVIAIGLCDVDDLVNPVDEPKKTWKVLLINTDKPTVTVEVQHKWGRNTKLDVISSLPVTKK